MLLNANVRQRTKDASATRETTKEKTTTQPTLGGQLLLNHLVGVGPKGLGVYLAVHEMRWHPTRHIPYWYWAG